MIAISSSSFSSAFPLSAADQAAGHVRADDLAVGLAQDGRRGHELVGDVHAVGVVLDHLEDAVDLPAGDLEEPPYLLLIGAHRPPPFLA